MCQSKIQSKISVHSPVHESSPVQSRVQVLHLPGARFVLLPPYYSPDLMPLEEVFAEVKALLRANDSIYLASTIPQLMVKLAFTTLIQEKCLAYIEHAGYM